MGIIAVVLGIAGVVMPYFASVFLVPAAFVCGVIAYRRGERRLGGVAIALAILGVIGIAAVSNEISQAQDELERSLRDLERFR
jgi:hypothetical protein